MTLDDMKIITQLEVEFHLEKLQAMRLKEVILQLTI